MDDFTLDYIDHVAIRVKDIETSASWYENVLGLKRKVVPEWGAYPILCWLVKSVLPYFLLH
ncbi:VOC family protein [uncultured Dokdonia sp.]|uniref:VOC family protein n=1 Tax=uncultured Dokdonia sp. TaxID=575653 RepID=UPI00260B982F|nr:VOC family protein [uncultured Dokdonia sp.]